MDLQHCIDEERASRKITGGPVVRYTFPRYAAQNHRARNMKWKDYGASKAYRDFVKRLGVWIKDGRAVEYWETGDGFDVVAHVEVYA